MTAKRPAGHEAGHDGEEPKAKYSVLIPASLDARVQAVLRARGVSLSVLIRTMLEDTIAEYEAEALGRPLTASRRGALNVHMTEPVRRLLAEVASLWNVDAASMAGVVLGECLPEFHGRGLANRKALEQALDAATKEESKKPK